jgi:hypothetical protein
MLILRNSAKSEAIVISPGDRGVSSMILQTHGNNSWSGSLVLGTRVSGSGLPFLNTPYQQLATTSADLAAGVAITGDGEYAVRTDGLDLQISHTRSAGDVDLAVQILDG